jgi:hypothetical protein
MQLIETRKQKTYALPVKVVELSDMGKISSDLAKKILQCICVKEKYPKMIAKELAENEQKIYYHIRNLEASGIVKVIREENIHGTAAKFYKTEPAIAICFSDMEIKQEIASVNEKVSEFFSPFIANGKLDAKIIVGSPDPHGPEKARSRDGYYGIDLALFIGTFLNHVPKISVMLDTEATDNVLTDNLIVIGGPITNRITEKINKYLPVQFSADKNIYSKISKTTYNSDETGIIVKIQNPFAKDKAILVVAGKRFSGTRAAVTAFLTNFKEIYSGNKFKQGNIAKVVEGLDLDSDGIVDAVEFRE